MITFSKLNTTEYQALRYDILLNVEENGNPKFLPYTDSEGIATIGIGFNLQDRNARRVVLETTFGFDLTQPSDQA